METRDPSRERRGLPATATLVFAVFYVVLVIAGFLVSWTIAGERLPSPFIPRTAPDAYFAAHPFALEVLGVGELLAVLPLAFFASSVARELRSRGADEVVVDLALLGGTAASVFQAVAACGLWVVSRPGVSEIPAVTRPLHLFSFAAGGPAFLTSFGLLVASVAVARRRASLPRWFRAPTEVTGAAAFLSIATLAGFGGAYLVLFARLACLAWMICVGVVLSRYRPAS